MMMERKDILAVIEKYKVYFEMWDAGVAEGIIGDNVFYVKDENNAVELFMVFRSTQELETIILGTLAQNKTCMITRIPESLCMKFDELEAEAAGEHHDVTDYLSLLLREIACIRKELREWSHMIEITFEPLKALGSAG